LCSFTAKWSFADPETNELLAELSAVEANYPAIIRGDIKAGICAALDRAAMPDDILNVFISPVIVD